MDRLTQEDAHTDEDGVTRGLGPSVTACRSRAWHVVLMVGALAGWPHALLAGEGGQSRYLPGSFATLIDIPPTRPGWVLELQVLDYQGDAAVDIPVSGEVATGLDASSTAWLVGGLRTLEQPVLGSSFSLGGFVPYVSMDVEASLQVGDNRIARRDTASGLGDLVLIPAMMAWKDGFWTTHATLFVHAPTGDYEVGRLANPGLNYWTFQPTVGLAYNNEENGFNVSMNGGFDLNTENSDTDYESGTVAHIDVGVQQLLPLGDGYLTLGVEAFWVEQVEGDSGSGARLGDFKGRTTGLGPVVGYVLPLGEDVLAAEFRWLSESGVKNRPEGDFLWFKLVYQF